MMIVFTVRIRGRREKLFSVHVCICVCVHICVIGQRTTCMSWLSPSIQVVRLGGERSHLSYNDAPVCCSCTCSELALCLQPMWECFSSPHIRKPFLVSFCSKDKV